MELIENRIINGLLKGFGDDTSPEELAGLLSRDVEIVAPIYRATSDDLWPAIWALATVLERQLFGRVFIRCGLKSALPAPSKLSSRCEFTDTEQSHALQIWLGFPAEKSSGLYGDARRGAIAVGGTLPNSVNPLAIECFLVAGYLGFAVLAKLVGVPEYRREYRTSRLTVNYDASLLYRNLIANRSYCCIGLGQLGQAFLSLLFFLHSGDMHGLTFHLIDKDEFEKENRRTQILLTDSENWFNRPKVDYIAEVLERWGANPKPDKQEITWDWKRQNDFPRVALVGLHDFETRRMVSAASFQRLFEAGVGTDLLRPRVSWHAYPGSVELGKKFFSDPGVCPQQSHYETAAWAEQLKQTSGQCGWIRFRGVSATAPCLGLAASALAMAEMGFEDEAIEGSATLWSPCLPVWREIVRGPAKKIEESSSNLRCH